MILKRYEAVHPTAVSENYSSTGMLTILIEVQTLSIVYVTFFLANSHILYK